jgi:predicted nucleic acid-binding protein
MILADSNVWIDMLKRDPVWMEWSVAQLLQARAQGVLAINVIIFAELAPLFDSLADQRRFIALSGARLLPLSDEAGFLASAAYLRYRHNKGHKTGVLPDFLIGAHAQADGLTLLTRDATRYRSYFARVQLICPDAPPAPAPAV